MAGPGFDIELLNALSGNNPAALSDSDNSLEALDSSFLNVTVSTLQEGEAVIDPNVEAWFLRLKNWVPSWFWEKESVNKAHFWALASLLASQEAAAIAKVDQTFILKAEGRYLDHLALELGYTRLPGETDPELRDRIRQVVNNSSRPAIELIIQNIIGSGWKLFEWETDGSFFGRQTFLDTGTIVVSPDAARFWIYVPFITNFDELYAALIAAKAAGISFVLIEPAL
jgi:hypothetical protein